MLVVFPDRYWHWDDHRPSMFGLSMKMLDYSANRKYYSNYDSESQVSKQFAIEEAEKSKFVPGFPGVAVDFLETHWIRPKPLSERSRTVRGKKVKVIQTDLNGERIDFTIDASNYLVLQMTAFRDGREATRTFYKNYVDTDGIMMASIVVYEGLPSGDRMEYAVDYQFNVDYDESVFRKPPPFDAGPEAWKKK